jgi:hypothetical protein
LIREDLGEDAEGGSDDEDPGNSPPFPPMTDAQWDKILACPCFRTKTALAMLAGEQVEVQGKTRDGASPPGERVKTRRRESSDTELVYAVEGSSTLYTREWACGPTREMETPLPSNSHIDPMILRVDLVGSHNTSHVHGSSALPRIELTCWWRSVGARHSRGGRQGGRWRGGWIGRWGSSSSAGGR